MISQQSTIGGVVLNAFTQTSVLDAALAYEACGFSVIPLSGKRPAISWGEYQTRCASRGEIKQWHEDGLLQNVGLVMGYVSKGLVCIDLDGQDAVRDFYAAFPDLFTRTLGIVSGSLEGRHLYFICEDIPPTTRTKGFELRSDGCYMVAPPSIHPSGNAYEIRGLRPIGYIDDLETVRAWIKAKKDAQQPTIQTTMDTNSHRRGASNRTRQQAYMNGAIRNIRNEIASQSIGSRNDTLFNGAIQLYQYVAGGVLDESRATDELVRAARLCGLSINETLRTLQSARERGMTEPRGIPEPESA